MNQQLASYAASEQHSRGRTYPEPAPTLRGEYQRDRDRVVHSAAFRRLEYKTQVFVNHEGDMFRTRLTHSIEVSQLARTAARALRLNEDLTEAIALAHDLGHAPFGHAGQSALNNCLRECGGFEHNLQALRVVDSIEEKYAQFPGLNLTFETREGILKHCAPSVACQLGEIGRRFLENRQPSLEAQITDLADAIAYSNHDVDDGLRAGLLEFAQLRECQLFRVQHDEVVAAWPKLSPRRLAHEVVRRMINQQVADLVETSRGTLERRAPENVEAVRASPGPLIGFSTAMQRQHSELKRFLMHNLYRHFRVQRMSQKGKRIVRELFTALLDDVQMLPPDSRERVAAMEVDDPVCGRARAVADYVAGMTDRFAIAEYQRVFDPTTLP